MKKSKKYITRIIGFFLKKFSPKSVYSFFLFLRTFKKFKKSINSNKEYTKFSSKLTKINNYEYKITSQNNEDGIIDYIFKIIPNNKYFIEIGFGYYEFNSLNLIKNGWCGKLIDINEDESLALKKNLNFFFPNSKIDIINTKITKKNVNEIISKENIDEIDFFSLDTDGNDYWILKNLDTSKVKVMCCEYNHWLGKEKKITIRYNENFVFKDDGIWGVSLPALTELMKTKNFSLIAIESSGTNAFFVNNKFADKFEILSPFENFISVGRFYNDIQKKDIYEKIKISDELVEL